MSLAVRVFLGAATGLLVVACGGSKGSSVERDGGVPVLDSLGDASDDGGGTSDAAVDAMMGTLSPDPADPVGAPCAGSLGFPRLPVLKLADSVRTFDVGNFTGDSDLDLVVSAGSTIHAVTGNGDGTWAPPTTIVTAFNHQSPRLGDLNGDGHLDLVYTTQSQNDVLLKLNDGSGSFGTTQSLPATIPFREIELADLNDDGRLDIVLFNAQASEINVLINSAGGFGPATTYVTTTSGVAWGMAVGDISGDGRPDIVVSTGSGSVNLLINTGSGAFGSPLPFTANGVASEGIALADLNEDGMLDVLVSTADASNAQYVSVLLNQGGNVLGPHVDYATSAPERGFLLRPGDINGDGHVDVLAVSTPPRYAAVFLGTGTGTLSAPIKLATDSAFDAQLVDVNADGKPDLLTGGDSTLRTYLNTGATPAFDQRKTISYVVSTLSGVQLADINSDNRPDLVAINGYSPGSVITREATGSGFATSTTSTPVAFGPQRVRAADLNNDARLDLVMFRSTQAQVVMNNGDGTLAPMVPFAVPNYPRDAAAGDFDGDGFRDLVVGIFDGIESSSALIFHGHGGGTVEAPMTVWAKTDLYAVATGHVNGDKNLDLVIAYNNGQTNGFDVLLGMGVGTFSPPVFVPFTQSALFGMLLRDFNGDGKLDILGYGTSRIDVWLGDGNGGFATSHSQSVRGSFDAAVSDLNGDGHLDLVTTGDGTAAVLIGQGDGSFSMPRYFDAGHLARGIAIADTDLDGRLDVVVHGASEVRILPGRCL